MKAIWIIEACLAAVALVGLAGCADAQVESMATRISSGANTPAAPGSLQEIASLYPAETSQACLQPQVGVDLILTDALRRDGAFDPSTVTLTLDGTDVTHKAQVLGAMDWPQSGASLVYTPAAPLAPGTHRAAFTYPSAAGRKTTEWAFTVADVPCPPVGGDAFAEVQTPGTLVPGQAPEAETWSAGSDIVRARPAGASQVCPRPQIGVDFIPTDAMRRNGTFDRSTVVLVVDGNDVTQQVQVRGSLDKPQSWVSLAYTPTTALALGAHRAAFTYPSATGRKTHEWTFAVVNIDCAPSGDGIVSHSPMVDAPQVGAPETPGAYATVRSNPADGSQACPLPQIGVDLALTDAMRRSGAFDLSTVVLTLDGTDVTHKAQVLGTMDWPQSRASLVYTPAAPLALGTHRAVFTYPSATGRISHEWTFTVANIACP